MPYQQVNEQAIAQPLQNDINVYAGSNNMTIETPTNPILYLIAGQGVLLGQLAGHDPADVRLMRNSNPEFGSFTIQLRKTGTTGRDRKFVVAVDGYSSAELKNEITRCIHQAVQNQWEVRFEG